MRLSSIALLSVVAFAPTVVCAAEPLAFPGYTWGSIVGVPYTTPGVPDRHNVTLDTKVEQGVDWARFNNGRSTVNTFIDLRVNADTLQQPWNNYIRTGVGAKVRTTVGENGVVNVGVRLFEQTHWATGNSGVGVELYVDWWTNWDLRKRSNPE